MLQWKKNHLVLILILAKMMVIVTVTTNAIVAALLIMIKPAVRNLHLTCKRHLVIQAVLETMVVARLQISKSFLKNKMKQIMCH